MAIRISTGLRNKMVAAVPEFNGTPPVTLLLYIGVRPAAGVAAPKGFIAHGVLNKGTKGTGSQAYSTSLKVVASGTIGWGVVIANRGGAEPNPEFVTDYSPLADFTVGLTGSGASLIVSKTAVTAGDSIAATLDFSWLAS